jgi:hypothetical protein
MSFKTKATMIRRWYGILTGKSATAVAQGVGRAYRKDVIEGYYNDFIGKLSSKTLLDEYRIPLTVIGGGKTVYFPIAIFQYALGLWDRFTIQKSSEDIEHFLVICSWIVSQQKPDGSWDCFSPIGHTQYSVSAMGQGEALSVLSRAYLYTNETKYYQSIQQAFNFMMISVKSGGTRFSEDERIIFEEYPHAVQAPSSVLNGWIFSLLGIYDYSKLTGDIEVQQIFDNSIHTLAEDLKYYDTGYWSYYDRCKRIASPAYHDLHIALLTVLFDLTGIKEFCDAADRWHSYNKWPNRTLAIFLKVLQKLKSNDEGIVVR